jgi:hypothetical protein
MASTNKTERFADQVRDSLNFKFGTAAATKLYDSNSDVYLSLAIGGNVAALVKFEPQAYEANNAVNPITGLAGREFVPDRCRVGFDLGSPAADFATLGGGFTYGTPSSDFLTGVGFAENDAITVGDGTGTVVFTAKDAPASEVQFASPTTAGSDADSLADFVAVFNAYAAAHPTSKVGKIVAVQDTGAPTKVWFFYRLLDATAGDACTLSATAIVFTVDQATFGASGAGVDGDVLTINGDNLVAYDKDGAVYTPALINQYALDPDYFVEGADAGAGVVAAAAAINASATMSLVVTAAQDGTTPEQLNLTATANGSVGDALTLAETGGGWTVDSATFGGSTAGVNGTTNSAVEVYVTAVAALTGVQVDFYSKSGIAVTDMVDGDASYFQVFRSDWGYINHQ